MALLFSFSATPIAAFPLFGTPGRIRTRIVGVEVPWFIQLTDRGKNLVPLLGFEPRLPANLAETRI